MGGGVISPICSNTIDKSQKNPAKLSYKVLTRHRRVRVKRCNHQLRWYSIYSWLPIKLPEKNSWPVLQGLYKSGQYLRCTLSTRQLKVWIISVYHNLHFEYVGWWGGCLFSLFVALLCLANYFDKTLRHFGKWGSSFPFFVVMPFRSHSEWTVKLSCKVLARHRRVYPVWYPIWYWLPGQLLSKGIINKTTKGVNNLSLSQLTFWICWVVGRLFIFLVCSIALSCQLFWQDFETFWEVGEFISIFCSNAIQKSQWMNSQTVLQSFGKTQKSVSCTVSYMILITRSTFEQGY